MLVHFSYYILFVLTKIMLNFTEIFKKHIDKTH